MSTLSSWTDTRHGEALRMIEEVRVPGVYTSDEYRKQPESKCREVTAADLAEWLAYAHEARVVKGHELSLFDNPMTRTLGFIDTAEGVEYTLSLVRARDTSTVAAVAARFGMTPTELQAAVLAPETRHTLITGQPPATQDELPPLTELEALWMAEAEQDRLGEDSLEGIVKGEV